MQTLFEIIVASLVVGAVSFIGVIFVGLRVDAKKITFYLISLASGTLLGGAFLHLIPESLHSNGPTTLQKIAYGVLIFFILEKFLIWRHCHTHQRPEDHTRPVAANMVLIGDTIHNFLDGVIIASAFVSSRSLGISITIAIMLHEIPQELGDFGTLIHGGYSVKKALLMNFLTGASALLGAILTYFFFSASSLVQTHVLPMAAGGLLYIALADLIPQLHEQTNPRETLFQIALLLLGFGLMLLLQHGGV